MKLNFSRLVILLCCIYFSYPLLAQDKPVVLQDSSRISSKNKNYILLKDTSLLRKDSIKKAGAAVNADSTAPTPSHLQLNVVYESNSVYLGRPDSTVLPLVTPEISYIFKSGFEIDFNVGINVQGPSPQVNSYTLDVSYSFNPGNYSGSVTLSGFNYSPHSGSPNASNKGSLEYDNSYNFNFIQPGLNLTWSFGSSKPDYQVSFSLQHEFDFLNNGNLSLTPTATMNASTQNAYNSYYQNKRFSIPRHGKPPLPANVTVSGEVLNSGKFQIMDYEFSAPVGFTASKWSFNFTPTYAVPVNPADIKLTTKINNQTFNKTYKESLLNVFYFQVGVTFAF
ncbi:MAG TPA: hypothetical protein VGZ90_05470 [Puia sp.]|nr:hypothetical protein [Puia sp.]